jgi:acyl transferase domain-containing protein
MMAPAAGQMLALSRAWNAAGLDPRTIGLVEAHGTGTAARRWTELATLGEFFGPEEENTPRAGLGTVKSMIGHTMPAAGAAGLIKATLAVYHGVLPPTLHCDEPVEKIAETRFRIVSECEPWPDLPRRAAVNAFGFGGINGHIISMRTRSRERAAML